MGLGQVGVEADGLEACEGCCEGFAGPGDFVRAALQADFALLGPRLESVGLYRVQRLVDYDQEGNTRDGVALVASSAALAKGLQTALNLLDLMSARND